jgi:hypothetical protein
MDRSDRIHGHYAANLIGSGAGALLTILLMSYVSTPVLLFVLALLCYAAGAVLTKWNDAGAALGGVVAGILCLTAAAFLPSEILISPYKKLALEKSKPQTAVIRTAHSPLGRIDVVQGVGNSRCTAGMFCVVYRMFFIRLKIQSFWPVVDPVVEGLR